MKHRSVAIPAVLLLSVAALASAQSATATPTVGKTEAQASFDHLKALAGHWKGITHMTARVSPDGKSAEFDFLDLTGETRRGHMHHALFTFIDADHHTEDWTWMTPDGKTARAHIELARAR